ncbi:hypothetical protein KXD40_009225 [Peronospora effusa]|nr:hypothetical protein KXD40_009225 [Peronospora effusa]
MFALENTASPLMAPQQQDRAPDRILPMQGMAAGSEYPHSKNYAYKITSVNDTNLPKDRSRAKKSIRNWGLQFLDDLIAAQLVSGGDWSEKFKLRTLIRYLNAWQQIGPIGMLQCICEGATPETRHVVFTSSG